MRDPIPATGAAVAVPVAAGRRGGQENGLTSGRGPAPLDEATSRRMRRQGRRDTAPELALRRELHGRGRRFFVDRAPVPGLRRRADVVFPRRRVAVYVDGCFWHSCPMHGTRPRNNADWWAEKLARNVDRDRDTDARLGAAGWSVVRVWEHEDPVAAADRVQRALVDTGTSSC